MRFSPSLLQQPIAHVRTWQAAIADPTAYTTELLSVCRLLCAVSCPREAVTLINAGNVSLADQETKATQRFVSRQAEQACGRIDARDVLFQDAPGPLPEFVSSRLRIKVWFGAHVGPPGSQTRV